MNQRILGMSQKDIQELKIEKLAIKTMKTNRNLYREF